MLKMISRFKALARGQSWPRTIKVEDKSQAQTIKVQQLITVISPSGKFIKITPMQVKNAAVLGLSVKEVEHETH